MRIAIWNYGISVRFVSGVRDYYQTNYGISNIAVAIGYANSNTSDFLTNNLTSIVIFVVITTIGRNCLFGQHYVGFSKCHQSQQKNVHNNKNIKEKEFYIQQWQEKKNKLIDNARSVEQFYRFIESYFSIIHFLKIDILKQICMWW
jgi:hypothetical protein